MDIDFIRSTCIALPDVTEDIKWGDNLCFSVGKLFCIANLEPPFGVSFKVDDEEFETLSTTDGFRPAPYLARARWVMVTKPDCMNRREWQARIERSYALVSASRKKSRS